MPEQDSWRLSYLRKLLAARLQAHYATSEEEERLQSLIDSVVINKILSFITRVRLLFFSTIICPIVLRFK